MSVLSDRRSQTKAQIDKLREQLKDAEALTTGKACVYATGSFGRCEASQHSDLDLFILGKGDGKEREDGKEGSLLKQLDDICIKADLIKATRQLKIPDFDGDGRYLVHYSVHELTKTLGKPEDDVTNTFTARLLLLLESCPLLGARVYDELTEEVVAAYWRDYEDHKNEFIPAFLANDILRLWRTFCVNYEARTSTIPEKEKAKRKLKNYKLKHSRLLTCYSALLYLLAVHRNRKSVSPVDALAMIKLTPTERLEWLQDQSYLVEARPIISSLLKTYELFLETTNAAGSELVGRFLNSETSRKYMESANEFGNSMFDALTSIGNNSRFHRLLVV